MQQYTPLLKRTLLHPLFFLFLIGLLLRLYLLGQFPAGFHIDEVKVGWNALSLLKTGQDDWGHAFPMYYNSFGDFRPTGYFYAVIPSLVIFGINEFAVRFPAALFGALMIFVIYFLIKEIIEQKSNKIALLVSLILTFSPWDISLSRASAEGIVGMFFSLLGLLLFIKILKLHMHTLGVRIWILAIFSVVSLITAYFFYHTPRLLTPIMLFITWIYHESKNGINWNVTKKWRLNWLTFGIIVILSLTTVLFVLNPAARGRFSQVSIFNDLNIHHETDLLPFEEGHNSVLEARIFHNKLVLWTQEGINEFAKYFSSDFFLVPFTAKPARYDTVGMGILSYLELFLLVSGLIAIVRGKYPLLPLLLLLAAPIPAALTTEDSPNQMRALYMIPFIAMIAGFGLNYLTTLWPKVKYQKYSLIALIALLLLNFAFFEHMYFIHNPQRPPIPGDRNVGAKEAAIDILMVHDQYDRVYVTNIPDSLYPWFAYFGGKDPSEFNAIAKNRGEKQWQYQNIIFTTVRCPSRDAFTKNNDNVLAVDAEGCEGDAKYSPAIQVLGRVERGDKAYPYIFWHRVSKEVFPPDATPSATTSK